MGEKRCVELTEENQSGVIQGTCGTFKQKKNPVDSYMLSNAFCSSFTPWAKQNSLQLILNFLSCKFLDTVYKRKRRKVTLHITLELLINILYANSSNLWCFRNGV